MSSLPDLLAAALRRRPDPHHLDQRDPALMAALAGPLEAAAKAWYRLDVGGLDHLPDGPALVVGNHDSGMTFLEAIGWGAAIHNARPGEAWFGLTHDGMLDMPGVGGLLLSVGSIRARPDHALELLRAGHKVVVFPGGNTEAFRPFSRRYEVDLAGRTGWARLAIEAGVPVVPVVFCGGHRSFFVLSDNRWLADALGLHRRLRVDTWPLWVGLPWGVMLGPMFHLPLPVRVRTAILTPEPTAGLGPDDVRPLYDRVTRRMREAMQRLAGLPGDAGPFGPPLKPPALR